MAVSVQEVVSGLREIQSEISSRYGAKLQRAIGAREDGMDLFQIVSMRAIKSASSYRGPREHLRNWLLSIAKNSYNSQVVAHVQTKKRSRRLESPISKEVCGGCDPAEKAIETEGFDIVTEHLNQLPARQGQAVFATLRA